MTSPGAAQPSSTRSTTRTGSGHVTVVGASDERANGWIAVDDQNPQRARILACLALTTTSDRATIQGLFHTF